MRKIIAIITFTLIFPVFVFSQNYQYRLNHDTSINLNKTTPSQFLDILSNGFDSLSKMNFLTTGDFAKNWVSLEDLNYLMKLIHSTEKCLCVVKVWSSFEPFANYSKIGGQAMNMVESYKNKVPYFPGLWTCAKNDSLRAAEIGKWWKTMDVQK